MTQEQWLRVRSEFNTEAEKAFELLYTQLWRKLYSVALNYVREAAVAQEIVQDVFVTLWEKRERLQTVDDIRPFAMRAVQNRIYDHFDKKAVRERYVLSASKTGAVSVNATEHQVAYQETFNLIDTEIDKLPDTTKEIFRLSRFEKFSNEEIASRLDLSVKSVEYHVTQALKKLRMRLKYTGTILMVLFLILINA